MASCRDVQPQLSQFVDGSLAADVHADVAAHLAGCAACRGIARDLERLQSAARSLGPIAPPDHIWLEVAGRIRMGGAPDAAAPARVVTASRHALWQWIGLAAAIVLVTLGVYFVMRVPPAPGLSSDAGGNAAPIGSVEAVEQELRQAAEHYDKAIAQLEAIVKSSDTTIDPAVAAVLQKNLPVMDQAIAESRAALMGSPANQAARDSLFEALRRKVSVLQDTVALMNEMRKGDQEGAARVAAGMNKKS